MENYLIESKLKKRTKIKVEDIIQIMQQHDTIITVDYPDDKYMRLIR